MSSFSARALNSHKKCALKVLTTSRYAATGYSGRKSPSDSYRTRRWSALATDQSTTEPRSLSKARVVEVEIGRSALFAPGTTIRTSDLHGMYDVETAAWLNPPKPVVIEPHTWFGQEALVLKGAYVGGGSVVAARALVNSQLPQFCVAAGSPAQPLKQGVCWSMERQAEPSQLQSVKDMLQEFAKIEETNASL